MLDVVIDLSHYNGITETSFAEAAAASIVGVIHKVTEGTWYLDGEYGPRQPMALGAGLLWGAYHFGRHGDAEGQAHYFLDQVRPTPDTLLVLDWEDLPDDLPMTREEAEQFVQTVYADMGRYPGLYSGMSFCGDQMAAV